MGIQEARNFIQENRWCYSSKNIEAPEHIKTTHKYWFISYCGHEFLNISWGKIRYRYYHNNDLITGEKLNEDDWFIPKREYSNNTI